MTATVRPWLPDDAFGPDSVERALAPVVATWSERWFSSERATIMACERTALPGHDHISHADHAGVIVLPPRHKRALIEAVLVVDLTEVALGETDRAVLDDLANAVSRDLLREIALDGARAVVSSGFAITLGIDGRELLTLHLPEIGLAGLLRAAIPRSPQRKTALARRWAALGPAPVALDAFLGTGRLSLRELDDMAPGDVILLDRRATEGADLRLVDHGVRIARGALARAGDKTSLCL